MLRNFGFYSFHSSSGNFFRARFTPYLRCKSTKPNGYWDDLENITKFLSNLQNKLQLNTLEDWNSLTQKQIQDNGGRSILCKHSLYEIICLGFPEGKLYFDPPRKPEGYWDNKDNVINFLINFKEKLNLKTPNDWNLVTKKQIGAHGGGAILQKYSLYDLKCLGCPDGKFLFDLPPKPAKYWENKINILQFLNELKEKLQLNTIEDWNSLTVHQIKLHGGGSILHKYSLFELKCLGCPDGQSKFDIPPKPEGFWNDENNVLQFLNELKEKLQLDTIEDWNSLNQKQIELHGGGSLLQKYSLYDLKCLGCPDGKLLFDQPPKPAKYWENKNNILQFLYNLKDKLQLNTIEDWNLLTKKQVQIHGGGLLFKKYSLYELKCLGCPDGKFLFDPPSKSPKYWENETNIHQFLNTIKEKYKLNKPEDWNLITTKIVKENGGENLLHIFSIDELKNLGCPEGKSKFKPSPKPEGYWNKKNNVLRYLNQLKEKLSLKTVENWNLLTQKQIELHGGGSLLKKYSLYDLKCFGCPEGKNEFISSNKPQNYWENELHVIQFLNEFKEKLNLKTPNDWNDYYSITYKKSWWKFIITKIFIIRIKIFRLSRRKVIF